MKRGTSTVTVLLIAVSTMTTSATAGEIAGPNLTAMPETALYQLRFHG